MSHRIRTVKKLVIILTIMLVSIQCDERNEGWICTCEFVSVSLFLKYPDDQPVFLDSSKVFWKSKNRFLEQNHYWLSSAITGHYVIVDDLMQKELQNRRELMRFTGYLNDEVVYEQDVLVGADRCHVYHLGSEPLTQVIYGIPDAVRKSKFCELVNVERISFIVTYFHGFLNTIDKNLPYDTKLQMIVDWLSSYDCIKNAHIDCVQCTPPRHHGAPNNSRIAFSFVENEEIVNMIMLVTSYDAYFAGFISE